MFIYVTTILNSDIFSGKDFCSSRENILQFRGWGELHVLTLETQSLKSSGAISHCSRVKCPSPGHSLNLTSCNKMQMQFVIFWGEGNKVHLSHFEVNIVVAISAIVSGQNIFFRLNMDWNKVNGNDNDLAGYR